MSAQPSIVAIERQRPQFDFADLLPRLVEEVLADRPPIDVVLEKHPPDSTIDLPRHVAATEEEISKKLSELGISACRRIRALVPGWADPVTKTIFYRPVEQVLFDALRDTHPVVLANTFEPQRYVEALQSFCKENSKQLWVWKGAAGLAELWRARTGEITWETNVLFKSQAAEAHLLDVLVKGAGANGNFRSDSIFYDGKSVSFDWITISQPSAALLAIVDDDNVEGDSDRSELERSIVGQCMEYVERNSHEFPDLDVEKRKAGSFVETLHVLMTLPPNAVCVVPDAHHFLNAEGALATGALIHLGALKDTYHRLRGPRESAKLILLCGELSLPKDLREEVLRIELPLPSRRELFVATKSCLEALSRKKRWTMDFDDELLVRLSEEAAGMTLGEVRMVLHRELERQQAFDSLALITSLRSAKRRHISRSPALELVETGGVAGLGGMERFQDWLGKRRKAFASPERAKEHGISRPPRGVLLLGIPGSGKSLAAKVIARDWELPLVRLDMGALQDKWVGSSEARVREALRVVEAMAPCILWIDEIDKGIAQGEGTHSNSVDLNIRATLLTWMQESRHPVFVVATANKFGNLPPELTRAGRFDARIFFGCPGERGRREIVDIHLRSRGYDPEKFAPEQIVQATHGFTGAEIEQVVLDALYEAFSQDTALSADLMLQRAKVVQPLIKSAGKAIDDLWDLIEQGRVELASGEMLTRTQVASLIDPYLFRPVYCREDEIEGFARQCAKAGRALMASPFGGPAAIVMDSGERDWIYVQTNFRRDPSDKGCFKFLDRFATLELNLVFDALVSDHSLEQIYFENEDLRARFEESAMFSAYAEMYRNA